MTYFVVYHQHNYFVYVYLNKLRKSYFITSFGSMLLSSDVIYESQIVELNFNLN
jgi:hypothetical protein